MMWTLTATYSECRWVPPSRPCRCRWRCRPLRHTSRCSHRGPSHTSCSWLKTQVRFFFLTHVLLFWQTHRVWVTVMTLLELKCSERLTCVAGAATPAWGAAAQEGVAVVETCASVTAGSGVALALTYTEEMWYYIHFFSPQLLTLGQCSVAISSSPKCSSQTLSRC